MRNFSLILLILLPFLSSAKEKIIVAFAPGDCPNCNIILPYISRDTNLSMTYVMRKRYAKDEKILKEKYLKNFKIDTIIYSDEMYKQYADYRGTTVSNETKTYSKSVRDISIQDIDFIEKYIAFQENTAPNTLFQTERIENAFQFAPNGEFYYTYKLYNNIHKVNLVKEIDTVVFTLDSAITQQIYEKAFDRPNAYQEQQAQIGHLVPAGLANILSFYYQEPYLYVGVRLYFETADTNIAPTDVVVKMLDNKVQNIYLTKPLGQLNAEILSQKYTANANVTTMNGYNSAIILPYKDKSDPNNRVSLALWNDGAIQPLSHKLPKIYGRGHVNTPIFSGNMFMLPLESKIFNVENEDIIDLKLFETPDLVISEKEPNFIQKIITVVSDFKMDDKYYYIIYRNRSHPNISILNKIDKKSLAKEEFTFKINQNASVRLNPYNFKSVLVPNGESWDVVKY